ncbi:MAG TPA: beta-N-acetylhexosaminidase [Chitinophagaceae bacterium]|nr:beta-N-acetylhexosaminidase [Chitinophagaceae bacterium]
MKKILCLSVLFLSIITYSQEINIIPNPVSIKMVKGDFILDKNTFILAYGKDDMQVATVFNEFLKNYYGFTIPIKKSEAETKTEKFIFFSSIHYDGDSMNGEYRLIVRKNNIEIAAKTKVGWFYGTQTLLQLLPTQKLNFPFSIPQLSIEDYPRFPYRGMHLDVSRHFFPVDYIKRYIDFLALHKMNYFHWHLTDDQGWRIEIKKYPKLTEIGAWRDGTIIGKYPGTGNDGIRYGGYYTQEQIEEIVQYAADRFITVIPEIDMPGHDMAALAAYPKLGTRPDSVYKVAQTWGIFGKLNNVLSPTDYAIHFMEDVLDEVMELFPSKYIHIGGDEVSKIWWHNSEFCQQLMKEKGMKDEGELQSYFIQRIEKYVNSKGRTIIGWDEILEGGLAPNAIVMSWRGEKGGIAAAKQNHFVIMTPNDPLYLNQAQLKNDDSLTANGYNPIDNVYNYEPVPKELNAQQSKYVLGAQGNLWTEYITNPAKVEYMLFPRMSALSEVVWSPKQDRDWNDFKKRMVTQFKRYDLWKVNYCKAPL